MPERHLVVRADATPEIGGGHIARCMALADALAGEGRRVSFAGAPETPRTMPALAAAGHDWWPLDGPAEAEPAALAARRAQGCDVLVVDHYGRDAAFEAACRHWARRIMVIDDLADRAHDCDYLLDPTLGRRPEDYLHLVPQGCWLLVGPHHALLRPQFAAARDAAQARRARATRSSWRVSIGAPARSFMTLPGSRVEDMRACMMARTVIL